MNHCKVHGLILTVPCDVEFFKFRLGLRLEQFCLKAFSYRCLSLASCFGSS